MLSQIWYHFEPQYLGDFLRGYTPVVFWMLLGYGLHLMPAYIEHRTEKMVTGMPVLFQAALITLIAALVMQVKSAEVQPFIYFPVLNNHYRVKWRIFAFKFQRANTFYEINSSILRCQQGQSALV
jgi:uncharacterized membrane protein